MPSDLDAARARHVKTIHNTCDWCTTWDGCEEVALPWPCGESQFIALADELAEALKAMCDCSLTLPSLTDADWKTAYFTARAALDKWEASRAK